MFFHGTSFIFDEIRNSLDFYSLGVIVNSSVIRKKGKSQNGCFMNASTPNLLKKEHFSPPDTHSCVFDFVNDKIID